MTPPLSRAGFWLYVFLVVIAGTAVTIVALGALRPPQATDAALMVVVGLLLLLELGSIALHRSPYANSTSASMMFIFALLLHWGLAGVALAILVHTVATIVGGLATRRVLWRWVFNIAQYAICLGVAHLCLVMFGIDGSLDAPAPVEAIMLPALAVAAVVSMTVNTILVGTSIALQLQTSWWHEVVVDIGPLSPLNDGAFIALAPLVVLAAERSPWLVPLLLVPLFAVYKSTLSSAALKHQAGHDALTGLPNRTLLEERATEVFADRDPSRSIVGLLVLDLDRFKEFNDTLGHQVGDRILKVISTRMTGSLRAGDVIARLGGDEFAVLLPDLVDETSARKVAARIVGAIKEPIDIDGVLLIAEGSVGIALAPEHGTDFESLLQHADLAMYAAKQRGTAYETYSAGSTSGSSGRLVGGASAD